MVCIGVIGAMEEEVASLINQMEDAESKTMAGMTFNKGKLWNQDAVVVQSGIGKVNMAICTQILVDDYQVDAIINTGIAGSLKSQIDIGDIVVSTDTLQHDMDATGFGYAKGQIPRMDVLSFPADENLIKLAMSVCERVNPEIHVFAGRVVSGDQFVSDREVKNQIKSDFDGFCTEMEGAAIAQAAYLNQVPYVVLRAISDKADDSATMDYPTFEREAIGHCVKLVENMVKEL